MTNLPPDHVARIAALDAAIRQANALEQSGQIDAAQAAYQSCLGLMEQDPGPALAGQLMEIWMGFGFCAADRNDWPGALEWYGRAEALALSAPAFNPDPRSAEAAANAQKWTPFLPDDTHVAFIPGTLGESQLGRICESIALAYDNAGRLDEAAQYYQRALDLFRRTGEQDREAAVWLYQAVGFQRRHDWAGLLESASQMLAVAEEAGDAPNQLEARRLLVQANANQGRLFRVLEHLSEAVRLGRQLGDAKLPIDEGLLRDAIAQVRPAVLERGQPSLLHLLVEAEALIDHPNLALDRPLLERMRGELGAQAGAAPAAFPLQEPARFLQQWALRHCGPPTREERPARSGLARLFGKPQESQTVRAWDVTLEEMLLLKKDANGAVSRQMAPAAVLNLYGPPEAAISVILDGGEFQVTLMDVRSLPGLPAGQLGYAPVSQMQLAASLPALAAGLDGLIEQGLFVKAGAGLQYVGPAR